MSVPLFKEVNNAKVSVKSYEDNPAYGLKELGVSYIIILIVLCHQCSQYFLYFRFFFILISMF